MGGVVPEIRTPCVRVKVSPASSGLKFVTSITVLFASHKFEATTIVFFFSQSVPQLQNTRIRQRKVSNCKSTAIL